VSGDNVVSLAAEARRLRRPEFWCARQRRIGEHAADIARQAVILADCGVDGVRDVCSNFDFHGGLLAYYDRSPRQAPSAA
jgi:hypothetical protein